MRMCIALVLVLSFFLVKDVIESVAGPTQRDPLIIKTSTVHGDPVKVARAVWGGRLFVFYFVYKGGVWWLLDAKPAVRLPK